VGVANVGVEKLEKSFNLLNVKLVGETAFAGFVVAGS
jgi:hypothetical protein